MIQAWSRVRLADLGICCHVGRDLCTKCVVQQRLAAGLRDLEPGLQVYSAACLAQRLLGSPCPT
jgi:hypothetical protein